MKCSLGSKCEITASQRSLSFVLVALLVFQNFLFAVPLNAADPAPTASLIDIPVASAVNENFDGIGTSATAALPTDFRVDRPSAVRTVGNYATATTATTQLGGANLSSSATNGVYNFGSGTTTTGGDRAIGFLSSGSATQSGNLYVKLTNNTGGVLDGFELSYDVEKYRTGTNAAGFRIQLYYSADGAVWTQAGSDFLTSFPADGTTAGFSPAPGATVSISNKTLSANVPSSGTFYLAWNYSVASGTTTTNAQALAIDNVSIKGTRSTTGTPTPTPEPSPTATPAQTNPSGVGSAVPASVLPGGMTSLSVNVTPGANPASTGITVSADLSAIGGSAAQPFSGNGNAFSFVATVPNGTTPGAKLLPFTITDDLNRTGSGVISLNIEQPPTPVDHMVISQIYGGGGNSSATYRNDFVELYNPSSVPFDLGGWTVQYGAATNTTWTIQPLGGVVQPGEYYLVALASGGSGGDPLPVDPNIAGSINMSGTTGKVALVNSGDPLNGCVAGDPTIVDLVGYGTTANCREGATNAPAPSNSTSIFRKNSGLTDTNVNSADFVTGVPSPRRTAPITEIGPYVLTTNPRRDALTAPRDASIQLVFTEAVTVDPNWINIACASTGSHNDATVASSGGGMTWVVTPNTNFQAGEQCTVTVFKDTIHDVDTDDTEPNTDTLTADRAFSFKVATGAAPAYGPEVHLTMGNPSDAVTELSTPNNYLMTKPEYSLSYNRDRGTPNWVSWHLSDEWVGTLDREDTFRPDPAVPSDWYRVQDSDYFGSGFDRGHMVPNADRDPETSVPINQATFLMTNMIPQAPDNNQGPWANMENYLRTLLPANELYIVAGGAGNGGTGSSGQMTTFAGGKIAVPAVTWKVALVIPKGSDDISRVTQSTRTIAVILPNTQGIRNSDWQNYLTTIDEVETLTGYDFFENLPDAIENSIEAGRNGVNPPAVENSSISLDEDGSKAVTLTAVSGGSLTYTIVNQPLHGAISGVAPNLIYTPVPDYNGPDSLTFRASSGGQTSSLATISITVNPVNDVPVATPGAIVTNEDTPSAVFAFAGTDVDGDALTYEVVSNPTRGTFINGVYTPAENYNGSDSFTFVAKDATTTSPPATISITVDPVNDAPAAVGDSLITNEDTPANIGVLANDTDIEGDVLSVSAVTQGTRGLVTINPDKTIRYAPQLNYFGTDSFSYTVSDGKGGTATANVSVIVNPVNDLPAVSNNLAAQSAQYSDLVQTVEIAAADIETTASSLTAAVRFSNDNGATWVSGLPEGLNFGPGAASGRWTVSGAIAAPAGAYAIQVAVTDSDNGTTQTSFSIVVNKEKTATDYTGDFDLMTAGPAISTANVRLAAQLTQDNDGSSGDLSKATATFRIFKFNAVNPTFVVANVPVDADGRATSMITLPADTYSISVDVDAANSYWIADPINLGLLSISIPSDELRSTGGGWVADPTSASGKANLAFTVSATKNGQPKGNVSFSFRGSDGFNYLVKGNSWQGGYLQFSAEPGVNPAVYTGSNFKGNCTVQKIDPVTGVVVESFGNHTFEIFTRDGNLLTPRQDDSFSITVRTSTNSIFHQVGSQNSLVRLSGGNITNKGK